jgi:hypothetical protein
VLFILHSNTILELLFETPLCNLKMENESSTSAFPDKTDESYLLDGLLLFPALGISFLSFFLALYGYHRSSSSSHNLRIPLILGSFVFIINLGLSSIEQVLGWPMTLRHIRVM